MTILYPLDLRLKLILYSLGFGDAISRLLGFSVVLGGNGSDDAEVGKEEDERGYSHGVSVLVVLSLITQRRLSQTNKNGSNGMNLIQFQSIDCWYYYCAHF